MKDHTYFKNQGVPEPMWTLSTHLFLVYMQHNKKKEYKKPPKQANFTGKTIRKNSQNLFNNFDPMF